MLNIEKLALFEGARFSKGARMCAGLHIMRAFAVSAVSGFWFKGRRVGLSLKGRYVSGTRNCTALCDA